MKIIAKLTLLVLTTTLYVALSSLAGQTAVAQSDAPLNQIYNDGASIQFAISGIEGQIEGQAGGYTFVGPITSDEIHLTGTTSFTLEEGYTSRAGMSAYIEGSLGCAERVQYDWQTADMDEKGYVTPPVGSGATTYEGHFDLILTIPPDCDVIGSIYVNQCNHWNICGGAELTIKGQAAPTENATTTSGGLIYLLTLFAIALISVTVIIAQRKKGGL